MMNEDKQAWIGAIGKVLGFAAPISLIFSVTYDWGFFRAINMSFSESPTSLSDHVRSVLVWLPIAVISFGGYFLFELLSQRIEGGMTEDEIVASSQNPKWTKKFRDSPFKFIKFLAPIIVCSYLLFGELFLDGVPFALVILWFIFGAWINDHPRIKAQRSHRMIMAILFIPPIFIYLWGYGYVTARKEVFSNKATHRIHMRSDQNRIDNVVLLRSFEKVIIVKNLNDNNVNIIRWDSISYVESNTEVKKYKGLISKYINI